MEITVSHVEGRVAVTVFQIDGELTVESYEELQQLAEEDYAAGTRNILLDLAGLSYLSSAGLRAIHHLYQLLRGDTSAEGEQAVRAGVRSGRYRSAHLKLLSPQEKVLQTLRTAGFDMFLDIHVNRQEAIDSF
jgi:anti-anti-sigma factor